MKKKMKNEFDFIVKDLSQIIIFFNVLSLNHYDKRRKHVQLRDQKKNTVCLLPHELHVLLWSFQSICDVSGSYWIKEKQMRDSRTTIYIGLRAVFRWNWRLSFIKIECFRMKFEESFNTDTSGFRIYDVVRIL